MPTTITRTRISGPRGPSFNFRTCPIPAYTTSRRCSSFITSRSSPFFYESRTPFFIQHSSTSLGSLALVFSGIMTLVCVQAMLPDCHVEQVCNEFECFYERVCSAWTPW